MLKQLINILFTKKTSQSKCNETVYKIVRKDGSEIIKLKSLDDAEEFSVLLNNLYTENNINDKARVISC